jgi:hypothetical protein
MEFMNSISITNLQFPVLKTVFFVEKNLILTSLLFEKLEQMKINLYEDFLNEYVFAFCLTLFLAEISWFEILLKAFFPFLS